MKYAKREPYRCEATSLGGFIHKLAVDYIPAGYYHYVVGKIPERNRRGVPIDPRAVDAKLIAKYNIDLSKYQRYRRKQERLRVIHGEVKLCRLANVQLLRLGRLYALLATGGEHENFFSKDRETGEGIRIKDLRRDPLTIAGYSITHTDGETVTRISQEQYRLISDYFLDRTFLWSKKRFEHEFRELSFEFEPYRGVLKQLHGLRVAINAKRKTQGLENISEYCIRRYRTRYEPFAVSEAPEHRAA